MSYFSPTSSSSGSRKDSLMLGQGSSSLSWCPSLNIYRVNRFNIVTNDKPNKRFTSNWINDKDEYKKFDIIEELLNHNMIHVAEGFHLFIHE